MRDFAEDPSSRSRLPALGLWHTRSFPFSQLPPLHAVTQAAPKTLAAVTPSPVSLLFTLSCRRSTPGSTREAACGQGDAAVGGAAVLAQYAGAHIDSAAPPTWWHREPSPLPVRWHNDGPALGCSPLAQWMPGWASPIWSRSVDLNIVSSARSREVRHLWDFSHSSPSPWWHKLPVDGGASSWSDEDAFCQSCDSPSRRET
jgi:hypothetical protein